MDIKKKKMNSKLLFSTQKIILIVFSFFSILTHAQDPIHWTVKSKSIGNNLYELNIHAKLEKEWHLYSQYLEKNEGYDPFCYYIKEFCATS